MQKKKKKDLKGPTRVDASNLATISYSVSVKSEKDKINKDNL